MIQKRSRLGSRALTALCFVMLAIGVNSAPALADTFPSRTITMIVSVPPGGPLDAAARIIAPPLGKALGQPVVIRNRPGASQKIGIHSMLTAPKDGYTIAAVSPAPMTINPLIDKHVGYNPEQDFTYLTQAVSLYYVLCANPSVPVKSIRELVAYVKAHPNKLAYSNGGIGTFDQLETYKLLKRLGINILPVQYKGDGPALMGLLGNQTQLMVVGIGNAMPFIKRGQLVPLATTGPKRLASLPNVPTYGESGFPALKHFVSQSWIGFAAAAGIPAAATKKLHEAFVEALRDPKVRKSYNAAGFTVVGSNPSDFAAMVRSSLEANREVLEGSAKKAH